MPSPTSTVASTVVATPAIIDEMPEMNGVRQTDSMSNLSDMSGNTAVQTNRPRMDVACVIDTVHPDHIAHRKCALDELKQACSLTNANLHQIQFEKLDFGETNVLDTFYNADVAVVDLSVQLQQSALSYHLGVRESFGMKGNILLYNDIQTEQTLRLKLSCGNYTFLPYILQDCGSCVLTNTTKESCENKQSLMLKFKKLLQDVEIQSKTHMREKFLSDLRLAREQYVNNTEELTKVLHNMRKRLDDPNVLSGEVVHSYMCSLRDTQDYDAMVQLVNDLRTIPNKRKHIETGNMKYMYAFALNRRNADGDREKALNTCVKALERKENHFPDMLCLCGRIYKDKFVESNHTDMDSLKNAIRWYRRSFEVQPNEYAGINLATLLVIDGKDFSNTEELQHIGMVLNNLIGKKGSLFSLNEYWDVATFFEISVLAEDYSKAIQAAECMFKLKPPNWYLKSTIGNIALIDRFRKKTDDVEQSPEQSIFQFWMEFFHEATKEGDLDMIRFPILILEPQRIFMPSFVIINIGAEEQSIQITNLCLAHSKGTCKKVHDFLFTANQIKSVSLYKRDERSAYLYVHHNSDDFQMYFPSAYCRQRFYDLVREMTADQEVFVDLSVDTNPIQDYEYDVDDQGRRIILGKGTYGVVYAARDLNTHVRIAVKEVPEKFTHEVQPLHEEIKLHSQLRHRNIVQYLGSVSENGFFKIFMEQVPGGSLSALLRSKWGPLKDNESTIAFYSKQILEGLKYLHDQKIVHRDIKGDNVLVNTYSGVLKISDFGTSKRLAGINPITETFAGTLQYMAPEVIDQGFRGYGPAADVWSFGCTNVEMATGKPPFVELGSPQAAMFKVGFYKSHPEIPEMSSMAERFILRCFEVDVDKRATAAQLLEDPFLSEKHRKSRILNPTNNTEFIRSVSVPADRMISKNAPPFNPITTPVTPDLDTSMSTRTSPKTLSRTHLAPIQIPIPIIMTQSLACSPLIDTDHDVDTTFSLNRRSSSGVLLSPEVEMTGSISKPLTEASESDGFYMLKKDSQRRTTLSKVLTHDEQKICDVWMDKIENNHNVQVVISKDNLETMSRALRDYIIDQNTESLQNVLISLKKKLSSDATAIDHLHLALYSFQDAVNTVLRSHSIKPHWMFALDSLVSNAVQAAITVLSPELGANLAGRLDNAEEEEMSTSGVSTVNSTKMKPSGDTKYLNEEFSKLKVQNMHLMQNLLESHKLYQALLKSTIEEQRLNLDLLRNFSSQLTNATVLYERSISQGYHSDVSDMTVGRTQNDLSPNSITEVDAINNNNNNRNMESNLPRKSVLITNQNQCKADAQPKITSPGRRLIGNREQNALTSIPVDARLNDWLNATNIDSISKNLILAEQFTYDDFIYGMEKTDLQRIGLKCGVEVKVWRAIIKHRTQFPDATQIDI
ncbi:mitogen-activated protein kinase kinase kinase 15 isoform X2 [Contarinia nasturtii]|uniref:mitogen-activated protein kinase kinase kinase 15 isoform X2 n=1 Tax=Contarinia nasturtii TaxID=265458 RepID=UPI0012D48B91|nr:mitogen-activated protein kinase kinase kinase 15 isoform X2 [Contarinia nasturtii]